MAQIVRVTFCKHFTLFGDLLSAKNGVLVGVFDVWGIWPGRL